MRRHTDAGVTLVEVLVVLVLVGVMAGAIGLSLGPADRENAAYREATLLTARLNRAADEAVLAGMPMAFHWDQDGYWFEVRGSDDWQPHPVPLLGTRHDMTGTPPRDADGGREGRYVIDGDLLPASGTVLRINLRSAGGPDQNVAFDGVNAWQEVPE